MPESNWKPWWILFPLRGLAISNKRHDLNTSPLFGDATILAPEHIERAASSIAQKNRVSRTKFSSDDLNKILGRLPLGRGQADAYLAIKRIANMSSETHKTRALTQARKRAHQIAAALCMLRLAWSSHPLACGLYELTPFSAESYSMFDALYTRWAAGFALKQTPFEYSNWPIPRASIRNVMLRRHPTRWLSDALICRQPPLRKALEDVITDGTLRLAEAVYSQSGAARVIGAVISIEVLLMYNTSDYDWLERRVQTLLGKWTSDYYKASDVFDARHKCVHLGIEISDSDIQLRAIGLALACLLRYAEAARHFPHKQAVLDYLDWLAHADGVARRLTAEEGRAFDNAVTNHFRHRRGGAPLAWVPVPPELVKVAEILE